MKKYIILLTMATAPFISNAQEIGLAENYKTKKEKRLERFTPNESGDLILNSGLSTLSRAFYGGLLNFGAEYMLSEKLGIRATLVTNNLSSISNIWGYQRASIDVTYHFVQKKRWDLYAFAGLGAERFRYSIYGSDALFNTVRPIINAGVGARYKVTPSFGVQAELGKLSNIGIYKKFGFGRK